MINMSLTIKVGRNEMNKMDWENNQSEVVVFSLLAANYEVFKQVGLYQDNKMKISLERVFDNFEIETDKKAKIDYLDGLSGLVDKGIISIADDITKIKFTSAFTLEDTKVFTPETKFTMVKVDDIVAMMKDKRPLAKHNITVYLNVVSRTNNKLFHMSYDEVTYQYTNREMYGEQAMTYEMSGEETTKLAKICTWTSVDKMCCSRSQEDKEIHNWIDRRTFLSTVERLEKMNLLKAMQSTIGEHSNSLVFFKPEHKKIMVQLYNRKEDQKEYKDREKLKERANKTKGESKQTTSGTKARNRFRR